VHSPENIDTVRVPLQRSPKKSTSTIRDIQMIGAMNIEKRFEFVSILKKPGGEVRPPRRADNIAAIY
jgi:hypothetical protein